MTAAKHPHSFMFEPPFRMATIKTTAQKVYPRMPRIKFAFGTKERPYPFSLGDL